MGEDYESERTEPPCDTDLARRHYQRAVVLTGSQPANACCPDGPASPCHTCRRPSGREDLFGCRAGARSERNHHLCDTDELVRDGDRKPPRTDQNRIAAPYLDG